MKTQFYVLLISIILLAGITAVCSDESIFNQFVIVTGTTYPSQWDSTPTIQTTHSDETLSNTAQTSSEHVVSSSSSSMPEPISVTSNPESGSIIGPNTSITFYFSESMNTASIEFFGSMSTAIKTEELVWTTTENPQDTLTLMPKSQWVGESGAGASTLSLSISGDGLNNNTLELTEMNFTLDQTPPNYLAEPESRAPILDSTPIMLSFDESIRTDTLSISPTGSLVSYFTTFETTTHENDTLILTPTASWSMGPGSFDITCSDIYDNTSTFRLDYRVQSNILYVSKTTGSTGNAGTPLLPLDTLSEAISNLGTPTEPVAIFVAEGTYTEDVNVAHDKISIYGGFSSSDWSQSYDPSTTVIEGVSITLQITGVTQAMEVAGLTIQGGSGTTNYGIKVENGSPLIRNCIIQGGTGADSYAVYFHNSNATDPGPTIEKCSIIGGAGSSQTRGIDSNNVKATIRNNFIQVGGSAGSELYRNNAIYLYNSSSDVHNNHIASITNNGFIGIVIDGVDPVLVKPDIVNNIIIYGGMPSANGVGIKENNTGSDLPYRVRNNNFTGVGYYYHDNSAGPVTAGDFLTKSISTVEATDTLSNLHNTQEMLASFDTRGYYTGSMTGLSFQTSGKTLSEFNEDYDGNKRTPPWSIGPYEYDL